MLDKPKPDYGVLGKNIAPCRSVHVHAIVDYVPDTGTKARYNVYEIGPPGTSGYTPGRPKKSGADLTLSSEPKAKPKLKRVGPAQRAKNALEWTSSKQTTLELEATAGSNSSAPAQQKKGKKRGREGDDPEEGGDGSRKIAKT